MITYEDALTGRPVMVDGVGHLRSPQLNELGPDGIGINTYNMYIFIMKSGATQIAQVLNIDDSQIDTYNMIITDASLRALFREALDFFISETVFFDQEAGCYVVANILDDEESVPQIVGYISKENFDDVRTAILELNYIPISTTDIKTEFSSSAAEEAWKKMQAYEQQLDKKTMQDESLTLGNFISKLCVIHPSYNLLNVYDLTVFQFYDAFYQCSYMRSISFSEAIVSNHGGDSFHFEDWMKPIKQ